MFVQVKEYLCKTMIFTDISQLIDCQILMTKARLTPSLEKQVVYLHPIFN